MPSRFGDDPVEASPPAVSRFGDAPVASPAGAPDKPGFFESAFKGSATAQAVAHPIDTLISLTGHKDLESAAELYKAGDKKAAAGKVLRWAATGGFAPIPGLRIGADMAQTAATKLSSAHAAFRNGKYEQALVDTASGVLPFLSSGIEGVQKIAHGDTAGGAGSIAGNVADLAVPFVPKAGRAAVRGVRGAAAGAVEALAKPGVPEMATGAAEAAAGLGGIATGHPVAMGGGAYGVVQGAKTFAGGLAKRRAATVERIGAASQAAEAAKVEADAARANRLSEMVREADAARTTPALPEQGPPMAGAVDVPVEAAGAPPGPTGAYQQYRQRTAAAMPSSAAPSFPEPTSRWGGAMPETAVTEGYAAMRARRRGAIAPAEPPMAGEVPIPRGGPVEENLLPAGEPRAIDPTGQSPELPNSGMSTQLPRKGDKGWDWVDPKKKLKLVKDAPKINKEASDAPSSARSANPENLDVNNPMHGPALAHDLIAEFKRAGLVDEPAGQIMELITRRSGLSVPEAVDLVREAAGTSKQASAKAISEVWKKRMADPELAAKQQRLHDARMDMLSDFRVLPKRSDIEAAIKQAFEALPGSATAPRVTVIPQKLPQQTPEFYAAQNRGPRVAKLTDQLQEVMQADPSITIQSLRDITAHEPSRVGLAKSFKWERPPSAATMMQAITELEKRQQQATTLASPGIVGRLAERGALGNAQELADLLK